MGVNPRKVFLGLASMDLEGVELWLRVSVQGTASQLSSSKLKPEPQCKKTDSSPECGKTILQTYAALWQLQKRSLHVMKAYTAIIYIHCLISCSLQQEQDVVLLKRLCSSLSIRQWLLGTLPHWASYDKAMHTAGVSNSLHMLSLLFSFRWLLGRGEGLGARNRVLR